MRVVEHFYPRTRIAEVSGDFQRVIQAICRGDWDDLYLVKIVIGMDHLYNDNRSHVVNCVLSLLSRLCTITAHSFPYYYM